MFAVKALEDFTCLDGHYLLSVDGTGYFSSSSVHCAQCCEKHHRDGRTTYYHQMLGAVLVHVAPEPIVKGDGAKKNDCERNALHHPHLKLVVVEDGLASNGPHIKHLKARRESDHKALFWTPRRGSSSAVKRVEHTDEQGVRHMNFLEYWETRPNGREQHFAWVTDLPIDDTNVMA